MVSRDESAAVPGDDAASRHAVLWPAWNGDCFCVHDPSFCDIQPPPAGAGLPMSYSLRHIAAVPSRATTEAPARLHLGFLDPSASLGRHFASLGLVIDLLGTRVEVQPASINEVVVPAAGQNGLVERLRWQLARLQGETGAGHPLRVILHQAAPAHCGLGSGTQLALALGKAFARSHGLALDSRDLAVILGRGERSGIGIAGFDYGGLLLDGGPGRDGRPAPLLARTEFPHPWRVILVMDESMHGLHGSQERHAMATLPPFAEERAAAMCHQVLLKILPAAMEQDFEPFAEGISEVQRQIGEYFADAQGGSMFTSPRVGQAMEWIGKRYLAGIGQSSWGPTGFAIVESEVRAVEVLAAASEAGLLGGRLRTLVVSGQNSGGRTLIGGPELSVGHH